MATSAQGLLPDLLMASGELKFKPSKTLGFLSESPALTGVSDISLYISWYSLQTPYIGEGVIFTLEMEDADTAFAVAKSKSLNIVLELRSEDWGQRHFCIQDPNGVYLDIVQSFEPTEEYQRDYVSE